MTVHLEKWSILVNFGLLSVAPNGYAMSIGNVVNNYRPFADPNKIPPIFIAPLLW